MKANSIISGNPNYTIKDSNEVGMRKQ